MKKPIAQTIPLEKILRELQDVELAAKSLRYWLDCYCKESRVFKKRKPKLMNLNQLLKLVEDITRSEG